MKNLTEKQQAVFEFVKREFKQNARFPSVRRIAAAFGTFPNAARDHLIALENKGFIVKTAENTENATKYRIVDVNQCSLCGGALEDGKHS